MNPPHETSTELFRGRHFNHEIITLCVRWYVTDTRSDRDLVEMMAERNVDVIYTTACVACNVMYRNSKNGGNDLLDQWERPHSRVRRAADTIRDVQRRAAL